jgi:hypothetical protein
VTQARDKAKAVFSGEVVEVIENPQVFYIEVRFKVENSWKHVRTDQLVIRTGRGGGDCGYRFEVGERYLVYAYGSDVPAFETNICQRTKRLIDAQEDLKLLGKSRVIKQSPRQTSNLRRCSGLRRGLPIERLRRQPESEAGDRARRQRLQGPRRVVDGERLSLAAAIL